MTKPTFIYVEDYVEFIGGHRDASGRKLGMFDSVPSPLSLARYDVAVVSSMSSQTAELNNPYTDKQAALAARLVEKYRRQLANLNPPIIVPDRLDQFRLGIRLIDRTKKISIEDGKFKVKFPYDTKLIDLVKKQVREGQGAGYFDNDQKVWMLSMTEHMLNWIMAIAPSNDIEVTDDIKDLYNKMLEAESEPFQIEMDVVGDRLEIKNASQSLVDYINGRLGGFGIENILALADNSEVLGYTVSEDVKSVIKMQYPEIAKLVLRRKLNFKQQDNISIESIVDYARRVNRLPVYVYEQGLPKPNTEEVVYLNRGVGAETTPKLLVTTTSLMIGSKKQSWMTNAEKIITIE